ncbi:MAG: protein-glutamate O-methyltransferase CheR [Gemmatimonadales bacterium]|nr:protein-glutamate O-methyltransferase CheR [Gemmatimonadales bacterium]
MIPADDPGFEALARKISGAGFAVEAYKDKCIRRRIAVRMRACGVHTYADYQALLDRNPTEYERLRDALTINVTRFYRNAETWNLLRRELIPRLCAPGAGEIRAWSAGCSSGEEPYTIAILAAEYLDGCGRSGELDRLVVDATDVDRLSLERAMAARYRPENLTEMPAELAQRYLEPVGHELQIAARVRRRVFVRRLDLNSRRPPRRDYHMVVCRNVLIYFDRPMQERLFQIFADSLVPGGYLVIGKVETLFGAVRERLILVDPRERVYRRPA